MQICTGDDQTRRVQQQCAWISKNQDPSPVEWWIGVVDLGVGSLSILVERDTRILCGYREVKGGRRVRGL